MILVGNAASWTRKGWGMERERRQGSFGEAQIPERRGRNAQLEAIHAAIDWTRFARLPAGLHGSRMGRKAYPALVMLKICLLQQWRDLSDPAMEDVLWERASFCRFAGLSLCEEIPDHSTISRYRALFAQRGLGEALLRELDEQLEAQGLFIEPGRATLMDATLIEAQASRRRSRSAQGPTDPDAAWGGARGNACYGCKGHIGVDADTQLIRRGVFTPANVNESQVAEALLTGDEAAVHADRAYDKAERRALLEAMRIDCRILRRADRCHPLTEAERELNALWEAPDARSSRSSARSNAATATAPRATTAWSATASSATSNASPSTCANSCGCRPRAKPRRRRAQCAPAARAAPETPARPPAQGPHRATPRPAKPPPPTPRHRRQPRTRQR